MKGTDTFATWPGDVGHSSSGSSEVLVFLVLVSSTMNCPDTSLTISLKISSEKVSFALMEGPDTFAPWPGDVGHSSLVFISIFSKQRLNFLSKPLSFNFPPDSLIAFLSSMVKD